MNASTGARIEIDDHVDAWRVAALNAALDLPGAPPGVGDPLPPLWHFTLFRETHPTRALGPDGHPPRGDFLPDTGLPRRMWAGGRFRFRTPLTVGRGARRVSEIQNMAMKQGSRGNLAFVTVRHDISGPDGGALREEQDIVYREAPDPDAPLPEPRRKDDKPAWTREYRLGSVPLFRYSALTFNAHRIHYDLDYCRAVEGYPGLVVHGPLLAQLMMELLRARSEKPIHRFSFRAEAPLFHDEAFVVCGRTYGAKSTLWILGPDERLRMTGEAGHSDD